MTTPKRVLNPDRLRQVPEHFSWLDHRLVREHYIEKLLSVADVHGLSYYGDATLARRLRLPPERLAQARRDLIALDLVAFDPPLYQVLSLPGTVPASVHLERRRAVLAGRS